MNKFLSYEFPLNAFSLFIKMLIKHSPIPKPQPPSPTLTPTFVKKIKQGVCLISALCFVETS